MSDLTICQITCRDHGGGAEQVALGLHRSYRAAGHDAWLVVGAQRGDEAGIIELDHDRFRNPWSRGWAAVARRLETVQRLGAARRAAKLIARPRKYLRRALGHEDFHQPATATLLDRLPRRPDVVHAHTLHGDYFDLRALPALSRRVPVVVTLHDMWLLSGGCFYALDCDRWRTGCGECPNLYVTPWIKRDRTAANRSQKQAIYRDSRLYVAAPSKWLLDRIDHSILSAAVVETRHIPNAVDLNTFTTGAREPDRTALGLGPDAITLLFAGRGLSRHPFKDYGTVRLAAGRAAALTGRPVVLLIAGEEGPTVRDGGVTIRFLGDLAAKAMAGAYRAADVYVHAARAENHPLAILEALACGTPVVATAVGGIAEQVTDGETGFLVERADSEAIARRIAQLAGDAALRQTMSRAAAATARRYGLADQASAYLDWYRRITSS